MGARFQELFHSPPGVLFTFPSRYWYAIGQTGMLRLTQRSGLSPSRRRSLSPADSLPEYTSTVFGVRLLLVPNKGPQASGSSTPATQSTDAAPKCISERTSYHGI